MFTALEWLGEKKEPALPPVDIASQPSQTALSQLPPPLPKTKVAPVSEKAKPKRKRAENEKPISKVSEKRRKLVISETDSD